MDDTGGPIALTFGLWLLWLLLFSSLSGLSNGGHGAGRRQRHQRGRGLGRQAQVHILRRAITAIDGVASRRLSNLHRPERRHRGHDVMNALLRTSNAVHQLNDQRHVTSGHVTSSDEPLRMRRQTSRCSDRRDAAAPTARLSSGASTEDCSTGRRQRQRRRCTNAHHTCQTRRSRRGSSGRIA